MLNNDRLLVQILLLVLFGASFWVMAPFWSALFWGAVLAFASWPLMRLLTRWLGGRESLAARGSARARPIRRRRCPAGDRRESSVHDFERFT